MPDVRTQQARDWAEIHVMIERGDLEGAAAHAYHCADRVAALETALREACHIAGCLDSLLAGVENEETLEACKQAANVWMRRIREIDPALAGSGTEPQEETPA